MAIVINLDAMLAKRKVRLWTLKAICEALDCQPGDIIEYRSN